METPKTIREVRDFLNQIDERFLDRTFTVQQENDMHYVHFLDVVDEDLYHHPDVPEDGNMKLSEWEEYEPETHKDDLIIGIPKGAPMIAEDF